MTKLSAAELKSALMGEEELALIDVREQGRFSESHLLFAICVPLSRLELLIGDLVPRRNTRIVVVGESDDDDLASRAAGRLAELGYGQVAELEGGVAGWHAAGMELFSGVNVPSKAFGEFVEHTYDTPRLDAAEVKAMMDDGRDMVIVDSRPFEEYHRMNIPTGTDMPGAELVYRIHELAPDPDTFVVVNCAGPDPFDHRRAEPHQRGGSERSRCTERRHDGLASRGIRARAWIEPRRPRAGDRRPELGVGRSRARREALRRAKRAGGHGR